MVPGNKLRTSVEFCDRYLNSLHISHSVLVGNAFRPGRFLLGIISLNQLPVSTIWPAGFADSVSINIFSPSCFHLSPIAVLCVRMLLNDAYSVSLPLDNGDNLCFTAFLNKGT